VRCPSAADARRHDDTSSDPAARPVEPADGGLEAGGEERAQRHEGDRGGDAGPDRRSEEADGREREVDENEELDRHDVGEDRPDLRDGMEERRADADRGEDQRQRLAAAVGPVAGEPPGEPGGDEEARIRDGVQGLRPEPGPSRREAGLLLAPWLYLTDKFYCQDKI